MMVISLCIKYLLLVQGVSARFLMAQQRAARANAEDEMPKAKQLKERSTADAVVLEKSKLDGFVGAAPELVVVVCQEDLSWLDPVANQYTRVTIYDKCFDLRKDSLHNLYSFKARNLQVQRLPNIGSCDYAFLTYIIDRWDSLPDVVEFTKGQPSNERYRSHGLPPRRCEHCDGTCDEHRADNVRWQNSEWGAKDGTGVVEEELVSNSKDFALPFEFKLDYQYTFQNTDSQMHFHRSTYKNMGEWMDHASTVSPLSRQLYTDACCARTYGGHFTATREQIVNEAYFHGRSHELYVWLRKQQHYANEEVDHFIERTWWSVFCAANHTK